METGIFRYGKIIGTVKFGLFAKVYESPIEWKTDRVYHLSNENLDGSKIMTDEKWSLALTKIYYTPSCL